MSDRQRLSLLAAIFIITTVSVPASSAHTADVMSPGRPAAMLAAAGLEQVTPDASCLTRCGSVRDRRIAELKDRKYWSAFDGIECRPNADGPNCNAQWQECRDACRTIPCITACNQPFQSCCVAAEQVRLTQDYDACVVKCPASKVPAAPPATPPGLDVRKDWPKSTDAALGVAFAGWGKEMLIAWEAYQATRPPADRAADDARRAEAFNEVRADLAKTQGSFAVVSGGGGRLWILRPGGESLLVEPSDVAYIRLGMSGSTDDQLALAKRLHLSPGELLQLTNTVNFWPSFATDFKSGQVLNFHPGKDGAPGGPVRKASSEHSSVRGTINGGGDFI